MTERERIIVTLDGPAGVGKTTLAKRVAGDLDVAYLDTGAMYRTVAWRLGEDSWTLDPEVLEGLLLTFEFSLSGTGDKSALLLNGEVIPEREIRREEVGMWASTLAKLAVIRNFMKGAQQFLGREGSLVAEGRDMGTVVFPDARYKFYLDAAPEVRAKRRFKQLKEQGEPADLAAITEALRVRDAQDSNRAMAPLRPADDAVVVDTGPLDLDGVYAAIFTHIQG